MKTYLNKKLCTKCGGQCCKHLPGGLYPEDLKKPFKESLIELFKSGKYAIDWLEADSPDYFIRPAIKGVTRLFDPSWGGECVFLTDSGCELLPKYRPYQCRMVEPKPGDGKCVAHAGGKEEIATAWKPYISIILEAAGEIE